MERHIQLDVSFDGEHGIPTSRKAASLGNHLATSTWQNPSGELVARSLAGATFFYATAKGSCKTDASVTIHTTNPYLLIILNGQQESQWTFVPGQAPIHVPPFACFAAMLMPGTTEVQLPSGSSGFHCFGFSQYAAQLLTEEFRLLTNLTHVVEDAPPTKVPHLQFRFLPSTVHKCIDKLHKTDKRGFALNVHCKEALYQIVKLYHASLMAAAPRPNATQDESLMLRAKHLIQVHFADPSFTVDSLAQQVGLSRRNLYRLFENQGQPTPQRLILTTRLEKARELLNSNQHLVGEVTAMVGFNVRTHFSKQYKQEFGVSPKEDR
ncbi:helix-turn-helix domain-containing protein [Parapedobacter tibetensis]|uniref:helix-turn-helix domain-containing protein n=1 Tax=Parapedobacter tibetensis TaxID=2972951 RepID=UPI00214DD2DE|nr:AraC family transcriptional regulator [Parapedobacter tibetensis]